MTTWLWQYGSGHNARARVVHAGVAGALVASLASSGPAAAATQPPSQANARPGVVQQVSAPASRSHQSNAFIVTLVTGDRVAVTRLSSGRIGAHFLPGSPSLGAGQLVTAGLGHAYVIPRTLTKEQALQLDTSLFDVLALQRVAR